MAQLAKESDTYLYEFKTIGFKTIVRIIKMGLKIIIISDLI